jgi:hypothetical protein
MINTITTDHNTLVSDHKTLQKKHINILKRRNRADFESGNVIYIISHPAFNICYNTTFYKFGKSTQTKDETVACFKKRLSTYNTGAPVDYTVHYLLYVEDNDMIEKSLKISYVKNLDPSNKEWIKDITLDDIIAFLRKLCILLKIDCKEVVFENLNEPKIVVEEIKEVEEVEEVEEIKEVEEVEEEAVDEEEIKEVVIPGRKCRKCTKNKLIDMFKKHGPHGHSYTCLECDKECDKVQPGICIDCNVNLCKLSSSKCDSCMNADIRFKERPCYERLQKDLSIMSYVACGKKYGVSDNSIRKWIRTYEGKPTRPVFKV